MSRRAGAAPKAAALILLAAIGGFAVRDLWLEATVIESEHAVVEQGLASARGQTVGLPPDLAPWQDAPRIAVHRALMLYRAGAASPPGTAREQDLSEADTAIATALSVRPLWGEAQVVRAYGRSVRGDESDPAGVAAALAASYAGAPFLRDAAGWRIGYALDHWDTIGGLTQRAVIDETLWLMSVDGSLSGPLEVAVRGSPAAAMFDARVRALASAPPGGA